MHYFTNLSFTELKADEVLAMEKECEFKPFQQVLVRDSETQIWRPDIFLLTENYYKKFSCTRAYWLYCIPYEGNEHLNGTTGKS